MAPMVIKTTITTSVFITLDTAFSAHNAPQALTKLTLAKSRALNAIAVTTEQSLQVCIQTSTLL